ncbi:MAG TPA: ABC transporter substrate-binding protein [Chloroflexia bacterium]|jgi:branched-chain amino acid transport system substrate-binding protein
MYKNDEAVTRYSRRRFLRTVGLAAGGLLAAPLVAPRGASAAPAQATSGQGAKSSPATAFRVKVGVLLPQSVLYPRLGPNFLAGMKTCLSVLGHDRAPQEISLVPENIELGASLDPQKGAAMLRTSRLNLLVGVLTPSVAASFQGLLAANKGLLLACNLGENVPRHDHQSQDVFYHTLGYWQANYMLGSWAATNLGPRVVCATSFYDSGYDALHAFRMGVESAGGEVVNTHISHMSGASEDLAPLMASIEAAKPDAVYGGYCGQHAVDFVKAYANSPLTGRVPLVGSSFLTDESLLSAQGNAALDIHTCSSWSPTLANQENSAFISAYRQNTGQSPDAFALLGFEAARLVVEAVKAAGGDAGNTAKLRSALAAARFDGPRGLVSMGAQGESTGGTFHLRKVKWEGRAPQNAFARELAATPAGDAQIDALRASVKTGWLNAYLSM